MNESIWDLAAIAMAIIAMILAQIAMRDARSARRSICNSLSLSLPTNQTLASGRIAESYLPSAMNLDTSTSPNFSNISSVLIDIPNVMWFANPMGYSGHPKVLKNGSHTGSPVISHPLHTGIKIP